MTGEPQYSACFEAPRVTLGPMMSQVWRDDPRRLGFVLARYKFVAKMLAGRELVAEIGCGDGFGVRVVEQEVGQVWTFDIDQNFGPDIVHDITTGPLPHFGYDAIYALDVLEHFHPVSEAAFLLHVKQSLAPHGVVVLGMPSLESQPHASEQSRAGHVNCKTEDDLRALLTRHFHSVFLFGMSDEVVHTGFGPMCHYRLAVCTEAK